MPAESNSPLLSESQRRVVGSAFILIALLGAIALLIGAVIVLGRMHAFFSGGVWPLAVAGVPLTAFFVTAWRLAKWKYFFADHG